MLSKTKEVIKSLFNRFGEAIIDTVVFTLNADKNSRFDIPGATHAVVKDHQDKVLNIYGNRVMMKGKHGKHNIHVRTKNNGSKLEFEGSPCAYLFGQNVFTSNRLAEALKRIIKRAFKKYGMALPPEHVTKLLSGNFTINRIDIVKNYRLASEAEVLEVIKQAGHQLHANDQHMSSWSTTVVYQPRGGKEFSISLYAKGPQMRLTHTDGNLPGQERLLKECERILRVEVRVHASELRRLGLDTAKAWKADTANKVFNEYFPKLNFLNVTSGAVSDADLEGLPNPMRKALALHKLGEDLTKHMSDSTYKRRLADFKKIGIDLRCPNQEAGSITSLTDFLSPDKVIKQNPQWMVDLGIAPPSKAAETDPQAAGCYTNQTELEFPSDPDENVLQIKKIRKI